jgi:hypothetical protein
MGILPMSLRAIFGLPSIGFLHGRDARDTHGQDTRTTSQTPSKTTLETIMIIRFLPGFIKIIKAFFIFSAHF